MARERCDGALPGLIPHTPSLWGIAGTAYLYQLLQRSKKLALLVENFGGAELCLQR